MDIFRENVYAAQGHGFMTEGKNDFEQNVPKEV